MDNSNFLHGQSSPVISESYEITSGLPPDHVVQSYTDLEALRTAVESIYDHLQQNACQGNQWLVLLGLPPSAIERLSNDRRCLSDINFRFMWTGTTGLIKVVPSISLEMPTSEARQYIRHQCVTMGVPRLDVCWGHTVTIPGTANPSAKEADECFFPLTRQPLGGQFRGWPTLVIETGVSESLAKLRREATWWFQNSSGDTRIVLLISVRVPTKEIRFEKWQLVPPNISRPVTRQVINQLRQQLNQMPPVVQQPATSQIAFCTQEVVVAPISVTGAPMVIPFKALFDREPVGNETDIVINAQGFHLITRLV